MGESNWDPRSEPIGRSADSLPMSLSCMSSWGWETAALILIASLGSLLLLKKKIAYFVWLLVTTGPRDLKSVLVVVVVVSLVLLILFSPSSSGHYFA